MFFNRLRPVLRRNTRQTKAYLPSRLKKSVGGEHYAGHPARIAIQARQFAATAPVPQSCRPILGAGAGTPRSLFTYALLSSVKGETRERGELPPARLRAYLPGVNLPDPILNNERKVNNIAASVGIGSSDTASPCAIVNSAHHAGGHRIADEKVRKLRFGLLTLLTTSSLLDVFSSD